MKSRCNTSSPLPPLNVTVDSIVAKIGLVLADTPNALNETETFILVSSVCIPHLARQLGFEAKSKYSKNDLLPIIKQLAAETSIPLRTVVGEVATEICLVSSARYQFEVESEEYGDVQIRNARVRPRLLGVLIHLANQLNLDQVIDPEIPQSFETAIWAQRYEWWRQAYITGVVIGSHRVRLHFRLPRGHGKDYCEYLVNPLTEEICALIKSYDDILMSAGINLNYAEPKIDEAEVTPIPLADWGQLKKEFEAKLARQLADRSQRENTRASQLRASMVSSASMYAEQMVREGRNLEAAENFVHIAKILLQDNFAYQSCQYQEKAAEQYLLAHDEKSATGQYINAAWTWLHNEQSPELANSRVKRAEEIATSLNLPNIRAQLLLVQSFLAFATIRDIDAQKLLESAKTEIDQIAEASSKTPLLKEWAIQYAIFAMIWHEWDQAKSVLLKALDECPNSATFEKIDILTRLLQVTTHLGEWKNSDEYYSQALHILDVTPDPSRRGPLMISRGVAMARQGLLDDAYKVFSEAVRLLNQYSDTYTQALAYQTMDFELLQNGLWSYADFDANEVRRIDLFKSTVSGNRGYNHELDAIEALTQNKPRNMLQHLRLATYYYWQDSVWDGIKKANSLYSKLEYSIGETPSALSSAISGYDEEATEKIAKSLLSSASAEQLAATVPDLRSYWPSKSERKLSALALGVLADVIPPELVENCFEYLLTLLEGPEVSQIDVGLRREAIKAIHEIMPQLTIEQINRLVGIALEQLKLPHFWTVTEELLKILQVSCTLHGNKLNNEFYEGIFNALLPFNTADHLRDKAELTAIFLAISSPMEIREKAIQYIRECPQSLDQLTKLVFLNQAPSESDLEDSIERIGRAINPYPIITTEDGRQTTSVPMNLVNPRMLNNFNDVLTPKLSKRVIDVLLEAIINENNGLGIRSGAIWALSDLPLTALAPRAEEVTEYIMRGAEGSLPRSSLVNMELDSQTDPFSNFRIDTGNIELVQQSSLRALSKIYIYVGENLREQIKGQIIKGSRSKIAAVRTGSAMALGGLEGTFELPSPLVPVLFVLLHDANADTCAWAVIAAGNLIANGILKVFVGDVVHRLVDFVDTSEVGIRVAVAVALVRLSTSKTLERSIQDRISSALITLSKDRSQRVRFQAAKAQIPSSNLAPDGP